MRRLYPIMWKELKDMLRDLRTLILITVLPIIILPIMGVSSIYVSEFQPANVLLVDEDLETSSILNYTISSQDIVARLSKALIVRGFNVEYEENPGKRYDLIVRIPEGFIRNLTGLDTVAVLRISRLVGSARAQEAENIVRGELGSLSREVSEVKVKYLASLGNITASPDAVLNPILYTLTVVGYHGAQVSYEEEFRAYIVRVISFSLIFVTTPSIAYITDSVIGEKERKTFEALLVTPVKKHELVVGKVFSASLVGLVASFGDALGLLLFFAIPSIAYGVNLLAYLTADLIAIHAFSVYLAVLASLSLIMPVVIRLGSYRASQAASFAIISLASLIFFMSLYVDVTELVPVLRYPLYLVPYTHIVALIKFFSSGLASNAAIHLATCLAMVGSLLYLSVRLFDEEKIIYSKT